MAQFLACHDYSTGGVWLYIEAETAAQLAEQYPALTIYETPPAWWTPTLEESARKTLGDPLCEDWLSRLPTKR